MSNIIKIQANAHGYMGKSVTLLSAYDCSKRVLLVSSLAKGVQRQRMKGFVCVSTDRSDEHDSLFSEDHFQEAIGAYLELEATESGSGKSLVFSADTQKTSPRSVIEQDGYDENGRKVRVADGVTCEQVAVLATCWLAMRQQPVSAVLGMFEQLNTISGLQNRYGRGSLITI